MTDDDVLDDKVWAEGEFKFVPSGTNQYVSLEEYQKLKGKLSTVHEALVWANDFFVARDRMNSQIHCAPVCYSPITKRIEEALKILKSEE